MPVIHRHESIGAVSAAEWNALSGADSPALRHEYFRALETSRSVGPGTGWQPIYLVLKRDDGHLLGAVPLFEKTDSRGEFIFDWNWAAALERTGRTYYPKLVAAIPFTPIPGPRLLLGPGAGAPERERLIQAALALAAERDASSLHWLFITKQELPGLQHRGCLSRTGCHFEWHNKGLENFEQWLSGLTAARRKKIRRERRRVAEAGIVCRWHEGTELDADDIELIYRLYAANYYAHGMRPYLTEAFFRTLAQTMPEALVVCLAWRGADVIAGAICLQDNESLLGRYWGAFEWVDSLHFEVCYYQGIERAIARGLKRFHPGVQGEHKLLRGFEPTLHYSAHWLRDADLERAVASFLEHERAAIADYASEAVEYLPFRRASS